ncbi:LAGLIDADG family homing endonuclease [Patescibacteria group bacterium]|nr:LAGLIDADG family homing endonuclease [Patescibacteria group bacterium]MBU2035895.1 LAGLIDADG family homing endonuclease [Patescibacteria group bacterium]
MTKAYLFGVLHDATERKNTFRIATKNFSYCKFLTEGIHKLGSNAWFYKEGKNRNLWIVEFSKSFLKNIRIESKKDKIEYIRGYFDSEGGIPRSSKVRFYLYLAQKNKKDLVQVKKYIEELNISCGVLHNPSKRVDPKYWRFFIRAKSYRNFIKIIGSYHPEKAKVMRMKI